MPEFASTPAYRDSKRLFPDYRRFHSAALTSHDVDPVYPVYKALSEELELDVTARTWLVFCHVAYYQMGSALSAFEAAPSVAESACAPINVPVGTERRAHWTRLRLTRHLHSLERCARPYGGDLHAWVSEGLPTDPNQAWAVLTARLQGVDGNGRWAAFKTAEMLQQIIDIPVTAPDMGHAHSSGPRQGMALLYQNLPEGNRPRDVAILDEHSNRLIRLLGDHGLEASMETTETTLCDFHSLWSGRYYVGHDIDQMLQQLQQVPGKLTRFALAARREALPTEYLGEINNWGGVDRERRKHYRRTGEVIVR